jgi:hypothetical protein
MELEVEAGAVSEPRSQMVCLKSCTCFISYLFICLAETRDRSRMSKVTQVYYNFVISKKKCVIKKNIKKRDRNRSSDFNKPRPKPIGFPDSGRFCLLGCHFPELFLHVFFRKVFLLWQTCKSNYFVKLYMAQQNIDFEGTKCNATFLFDR